MVGLQQVAAKVAVSIQDRENRNKKSTRRCFLEVTQFRPQAKLSRRKYWRDRAVLYPA